MYTWKAVWFEVRFVCRNMRWRGRRHSELPQGSPQHHLRGLRGGDPIEEGICKILPPNQWAFLRTGAELSSSRGVRAGTKLRSGGRDQGLSLGGLLPLRKIGVDLGKNFLKGFKPGSWTIERETKAEEVGQPCQGVCWGQRTGPRTGLSQPMETVSWLEPISRGKNLSWWLRTP